MQHSSHHSDHASHSKPPHREQRYPRLGKLRRLVRLKRRVMALLALAAVGTAVYWSWEQSAQQRKHSIDITTPYTNSGEQNVPHDSDGKITFPGPMTPERLVTLSAQLATKQAWVLRASNHARSLLDRESKSDVFAIFVASHNNQKACESIRIRLGKGNKKMLQGLRCAPVTASQ